MDSTNGPKLYVILIHSHLITFSTVLPWEFCSWCHEENEKDHLLEARERESEREFSGQNERERDVDI